MEYRKNPKNGDDISLLGMGMMRLPVADGKQDQIEEKTARAIADACYQGGVNYYDSAYYYHDEASEPFTGKAMENYNPANLDLELPMLLPGVKIKTSADDYAPLEAMWLGVFNGETWELQGSVIEKVLTTDSLPLAPEARIDKIQVLSVAGVIADAIDAVFGDTSVSEIFGGANQC